MPGFGILKPGTYYTSFTAGLPPTAAVPTVAVPSAAIPSATIPSVAVIAIDIRSRIAIVAVVGRTVVRVGRCVDRSADSDSESNLRLGGRRSECSTQQ